MNANIAGPAKIPHGLSPEKPSRVKHAPKAPKATMTIPTTKKPMARHTR